MLLEPKKVSLIFIFFLIFLLLDINLILNLIKIAEAPKQAEGAAQSDRDQYRRAPEGGADKKGEAGAGSYEFVSILFVLVV